MKDLIECYLSEQISEPDWQRLLRDTPGLQDAWQSHFTPSTMDDMKLVIRTQLANLEDDVRKLTRSIELLKRVLNGY